MTNKRVLVPRQTTEVVAWRATYWAVASLPPARKGGTGTAV
ncbi:MAG: hypothetical protein R6X34_13005 [Chloroflexota bacterium]